MILRCPGCDRKLVVDGELPPAIRCSACETVFDPSEDRSVNATPSAEPPPTDEFVAALSKEGATTASGCFVPMLAAAGLSTFIMVILALFALIFGALWWRSATVPFALAPAAGPAPTTTTPVTAPPSRQPPPNAQQHPPAAYVPAGYYDSLDKQRARFKTNPPRQFEERPLNMRWPLATPLAMVRATQAKLLAVSRGRDGNPELVVWDLPSRSVKWQAALPKTADAIAFSPDENLLAAACDDATVRLFDADSGKFTTELTGHVAPVAAVAFATDGKSVIGISTAGKVIMWDLTAAQPVAMPQPDRDAGITAMLMSPNGIERIEGYGNGNLIAYDTSVNRPAWLHGHSDAVHCVRLTPDEQSLVSGSADGTAMLWRMDRKEVRASFAHTAGVTCVDFTPNGLMLTGTSQGEVWAWNLAMRRELTRFQAHRGGVTSVVALDELSQRGESADQFATIGSDRKLKAWEPDETGTTFKQLATLMRSPKYRDYPQSLHSVDVSPDGTLVATGGGDGTVELREALGGNIVALLERHKSAVESLAFSPDGRQLFSVDEGGKAVVWTLADDTGEHERTAEARDFLSTSFAVKSGRWSPDGKTIAACGDISIDFREAEKFAAGSGEEVSFPRRITAMEYSPNGSQIAWAARNTHVYVQAGAEGQPAELTGHVAPVQAIAWAPDGSFLVSGGEDGDLRVWTLKGTAASCLKLTGHVGTIRGLAISPDGKLIISGGFDNLVRVWDATTGEQRQTLASGEVTGLALTRDGSSLYTVGGESIKRWPARLPPVDAKTEADGIQTDDPDGS